VKVQLGNVEHPQILFPPYSGFRATLKTVGDSHFGQVFGSAFGKANFTGIGKIGQKAKGGIIAMIPLPQNDQPALRVGGQMAAAQRN
jgi:hypothetical protein